MSSPEPKQRTWRSVLLWPWADGDAESETARFIGRLGYGFFLILGLTMLGLAIGRLF